MLIHNFKEEGITERQPYSLAWRLQIALQGVTTKRLKTVHKLRWLFDRHEVFKDQLSRMLIRANATVIGIRWDQINVPINK